MSDIEYSHIQPLELLNRVSDLREQGCRLIQICCSKAGEGYEIDYSFDKDYQFIDLKMQAPPGEEIASISLVFPPAFLYENEIEALFGIMFSHKSVDFGGKLYQTAMPTPFVDVQKEGE